jgi:membrane-bound serine protease (ClpP class)
MVKTVYPICFVILLFCSAKADAGEVIVVPIKGTIETGLAAFVVRVMEEAADTHADAVVFEIDTPGGALDAALTIRDALLYSEVKTIAFINPRAISAGALISLATDHIVMVEGGTIGAATAVDLQGNKASEKVLSYFRNEMKATAEKTGRNPDLAEAMVDEDVEIADLAPKGKLLTLTTEEALKEGIAEFKVVAETATEKMEEMLGHFNLGDSTLIRERVNWAEQAVRWLTYPAVASMLMTLGFLGLIFEIQSPGWGVGGTLALVCLGLFFGSHLIAQLAEWTDILLFILGSMLVLADVFFVIGFGLLAIPGVLLIVASLFLSLMGRTELWTWDAVGVAARPLTLSMVLTTVLGYLLLRRLPRSGTWKKVVLDARESGYTASPEYDDLLGATGTAFTDLRPGGTGLFDGKRVSVTTEGDYLVKEASITVVEVEGNRIVVRKSVDV